jgi:two-component system sensor histidine kinase UhpB
MNLIFRKVKTLIVEDEKIIAKDIESTVQRLGHDSAGIVSKGEDAVRLSKELRPDIVLMDITLRGAMDGIEAAKIINETLDIPVVYITAHQDEDTIEKTKSTNPYGYISKPVDDRDINSVINSAIYRYDVEKKLKEAEEKYFRLTENAADMIISQSLKDFSYNYVNKASKTITGYEPREFYSTPDLIRTIVHPDWKEEYSKNYEMLVEGKNPEFFEFKIIRKTGEQRWLNQRSVLLDNETGGDMEAIITDVTDRKKYETDIEESNLKLRALTGYLQTVREEERVKISREIHDQLGQDLTALKMEISVLAKKLARSGDTSYIAGSISSSDLQIELQNMGMLIDKLINNIRRIATELRPDILDKLGLVEAIQWHGEEFEKRTKIKCSFSLKELDELLDPQQAISLYRIFQETLTNVARHSGADNVIISFYDQGEFLVLVIRDNGKGITHEVEEKSTSLGIMGMKERALLLGGKLEISGENGKGTEVKITIPVKK